ncbi:MAG: insulinase family protein [Bacteroidales bacterium]|nr:insulinase family protein [Bacteroidales bacterium]
MRHQKITFLLKFKLVFTLIFTLFISNIFSQENIKVHEINSIKILEFKLENSLTVFLNEDHEKPEIFGAIITKAGGKDDPADATGMAHYQEHMLFKGTEELGTIDWEKEKPHIDNIFKLYDKLGQTKDEEERKKIQKQINEESVKANKYAIPNELSNLIKSIGGTKLNAGTGPDYTIFYNTIPSNQIEKWLEIYSHRFMKPVFRSFQAELEVVYEEKNMYADMFGFKMLEKFQFYFFKNHPYGQQTLIGTIEDLKNPSLTKMYEFFKTYYVPNNMALVLSGDFNSDDIIPVINDKFGKWNSGDVPKFVEYKEEPFNGREFHEGKYSPIKLAMLGFRTVTKGHPDEPALEICNKILSNNDQTGLLDKLGLDNKLLAAQVISIPYKDHGATIIFVVPKIVGQKLDDAEELVMNEIKKLHDGNFDDWMVDAIKNQFYKDFELSMEDNKDKAYFIMKNFSIGRDLSEALLYSQKINAITKNDIIEVAKKYYGDNYFAFYSKMGFKKKEKIEKPGFEPVISNTETKSAFAKKFEEIPTSKIVEKFVDFNKDITTEEFIKGIKLYYVKNPINDIFSLKIKFGIGEHKMPLLKYTTELMDYSGTKSHNVSELKNEFNKLGCTYNISSNESYVYVYLEGIEKNLEPALKLINELLTEPVLEKEKLKILLDGEKANRKIEKSEPDNIADALYEYVKFKNKSSYIDRLSMKEIKALNTDELVNEFKKATNFETEIHYVGQKSFNEVKDAIKSNIIFKSELKLSESPFIPEKEKYNNNIVYFVNKKNARQCKIYFFANGEKYKNANEPIIDAFNMYFGGGFSGLVLQEVREYRSLAYAAGARYVIPKIKGKNTYFVGYVGTQADKTFEALEIFNDLLRNMPEKTERMDMIVQYLSQSSLTQYPHFRDLTKKVVSWELKGYKEDPAKLKIPEYNKLKFNDITSFYKDNIKNKAFVIAIVGDKKEIDMKELAKYGKIIELKEKEIFTD